MNQDLSRQENVWCFNCQSGDKFHKRKWSDYYNAAGAESPITVGTILGILVDLRAGQIRFFKDGEDLGVAFDLADIAKE